MAFISKVLLSLSEKNFKIYIKMANLRYLKKEIDYRLEEFFFDCDMSLYFHPTKEEEVFNLMQEAVAMRNELFSKAMNPTEPHNRKLVRKYYTGLRVEMVNGFNDKFEKLSKLTEAK